MQIEEFFHVYLFQLQHSTLKNHMEQGMKIYSVLGGGCV